jgi:ABC-type branched-subunit amino acid transport system ATPase component/ABC-type branched-subunit amino acid transport system permease subunit
VIAAASFGANAVVNGIILGLVYGVLAAGLVLVYRASGVVNFAHGEIGALGAAVMAKLVLDEKWPFVVALPAVLVLGGAIGAVTEIVVARRLAHRPKLALLVATIGLSQLLLVAEFLLPAIKEVAPFPSPIHRTLTIGSVTLTGPDFLAIAAVPAIIAGLAVWLARTPSGRALRAAADNPDAARLAGVRPHRVALLAWILAGVVSTATAVIADPLQGVVVGQQTQTIGAGLLVRALVAALVGRLESLPVAIAGGVGVGLVQAVADSGHISQSAVDLVLLIAVLVLVLVRPSSSRRDEAGEGELVRVPAVDRPWDRFGPAVIETLSSPRRLGWLLSGLLIGLVVVPLFAGSASELFSLSRVALYAVVGLSVVVLTGWAGQLSLGQFAVVGIGTFGASVLESHGVPFWLTVVLAGVIGAAVSLLVGVPALRARGLDLAVTTLALAVACNSWLFTQSWALRTGGVALVTRDRFVNGPLAFYEACAVSLALALAVVAIVRRADLGRRLLAVRANERRAAAAGIAPALAKLEAFALSGVLAGVAGAMLAGLRTRSGASDFTPQESLQVVALAVIGGAGSPFGAVLGAVFVLGVPAVFGDTTVAGLLPTGLGLLVLVLLFPGGFWEVGQWLRDRFRPRPPTVPAAVQREPVAPRTPSGLVVSGLTVRFGGRVALDHVDLAVEPGQVLGLIGANGAGKSTTMMTIFGAPRARRGRITFDGHDITELPTHMIARLSIAQSPEGRRIFPRMTVFENLQMGASINNFAHFDDDLQRVFALFPRLKERAPQRGGTLSGGEQQMLAIGRALMSRPRLLLLDEPSLGLAPLVVKQIFEVIAELNKAEGLTVFLVEQNAFHALKLAHRGYVMVNGAITMQGGGAELLARPEVRAAYLEGGH